jgi:hypothetical protein
MALEEYYQDLATLLSFIQRMDVVEWGFFVGSGAILMELTDGQGSARDSKFPGDMPPTDEPITNAGPAMIS